jgi:hypothetical protein
LEQERQLCGSDFRLVQETQPVDNGSQWVREMQLVNSDCSWLVAQAMVLWNEVCDRLLALAMVHENHSH